MIEENENISMNEDYEPELDENLAPEPVEEAEEAPSVKKSAPKKVQSKKTTSLDDFINNEDDAQISLRGVLSGEILGGKWFRRNIWYILFIIVLAILYVSNRYGFQQEMIEQTRLIDTLQDRRYKVLTMSSQLKEQTRRSNLEEQLQDTSLSTPATPLFSITVDEED